MKKNFGKIKLYLPSNKKEWIIGYVVYLKNNFKKNTIINNYYKINIIKIL